MNRPEAPHLRYTPSREVNGLVVTDPNLDEQLWRLARRALETGETTDQKEASLRRLINHCEALLSELAQPNPNRRAS